MFFKEIIYQLHKYAQCTHKHINLFVTTMLLLRLVDVRIVEGQIIIEVVINRTITHA